MVFFLWGEWGSFYFFREYNIWRCFFVTQYLENYTEEVFERIMHVDEEGNEFWYARELMVALEYSLWQRFSNVITRAMESCKHSNYNISDHFIGADKMV